MSLQLVPYWESTFGIDLSSPQIGVVEVEDVSNVVLCLVPLLRHGNARMHVLYVQLSDDTIDTHLSFLYRVTACGWTWMITMTCHL